MITQLLLSILTFWSWWLTMSRARSMGSAWPDQTAPLLQHLQVGPSDREVGFPFCFYYLRIPYRLMRCEFRFLKGLYLCFCHLRHYYHHCSNVYLFCQSCWCCWLFFSCQWASHFHNMMKKNLILLMCTVHYFAIKKSDHSSILTKCRNYFCLNFVNLPFLGSRPIYQTKYKTHWKDGHEERNKDHQNEKVVYIISLLTTWPFTLYSLALEDGGAI